MSEAGTLLFVSPRFLLPVDSGGKIRTTQILRGLKGHRFRVHLLSPASDALVMRYGAELRELCDQYSWWPEVRRGTLWRMRRYARLADPRPVPVADDYSVAAAAAVAAHVAGDVAVAVFDFLHSAVLAPVRLERPSVLFTHNVEAEIFARHQQTATGLIARRIWHSQHLKMRRFEHDALRRFDLVVAVSDRDRDKFASDYGLRDAFVIPTGVDLGYYSHQPPLRDNDVVFCGSMDWLANQDAMAFFLDEIWPLVIREAPAATMTVVGRTPPAGLQERARQRGYHWTFTGFVDDVRPFIAGAAIAVVPLRIGGGTRLKVYESMAMGPVVVSTRVGVEGLPVVSGEHCLVADSPTGIAAAIVGLMRDRDRRLALSSAARQYVQEHFGHQVAATAFEQACCQAIARHATAAVDP